MSACTVKYFGVVAELTDKSEEEVELKEKDTIQEILTTCLEKYPKLKNISFKIAHNQKITDSGEVKSQDEIAFLPPFSGG